MLMNRKTVSIPQACELVGVCRRTIYNWISSGKVQYVRTASGSVRIFEETLWRRPDPTNGETHNTATSGSAVAPEPTVGALSLTTESLGRLRHDGQRSTRSLRPTGQAA